MMNSRTDAGEKLFAELTIVEQHLIETTATIQRPLSDLIRAQINEAAPHMLAAFVIAAASSAHDTASVSHRHRWLAAALEMLSIALRTHSMLVAQSIPDIDADEVQSVSRMDNTFVGSTILAGDYCFSRAAQMAAKTEDPIVVSIFAQALQTISEGQLRALFSNRLNLHNERQDLLRFGVEAALVLSDLSEDNRRKTLALGKELSIHLFARDPKFKPTTSALDAVERANLPPYQTAAWSSVVRWLAPEIDNGRLSVA